ncbi:MAG: hypothetical protein MJE66_13615, partial [Proteobacteria bacterium]|nr:hypothetical protein [Pseudomonadota bacterium]
AAGPWFVSRAAAVSGLVSAVALCAASLPWWLLEPTRGLLWTTEAAVAAGAALVGGVALGMLRERSLSLWPGVALVWAGALVALGLRSFWG